MPSPTEYAGLSGQALVERVMADKGVSEETARDIITLWTRPGGDVEELPAEEPETREGGDG